MTPTDKELDELSALEAVINKALRFAAHMCDRHGWPLHKKTVVAARNALPRLIAALREEMEWNAATTADMTITQEQRDAALKERDELRAAHPEHEMSCVHGVSSCDPCLDRISREKRALSTEADALRVSRNEWKAYAEQLERTNKVMLKEADALRAEVERLTGLIKPMGRMWDHRDEMTCRWCELEDGDGESLPLHAPDCPAFNADGTVRRGEGT